MRRTLRTGTDSNVGNFDFLRVRIGAHDINDAAVRRCSLTPCEPCVVSAWSQRLKLNCENWFQVLLSISTCGATPRCLSTWRASSATRSTCVTVPSSCLCFVACCISNAESVLPFLICRMRPCDCMGKSGSASPCPAPFITELFLARLQRLRLIKQCLSCFRWATSFRTTSR